MADLKLIKKQRDEIAAADEANLQAISRAYATMYDRLQGDVDALMLAIEDLEEPTMAEIKRLPQYKRLMSQAEKELDRFTTYLEVTIGAAAIVALGLGLSHSEMMVNSLIGGGFKGLGAGAMQKLLDYLRPDGPLYKRLQFLTGATIDKVVQAIVDGVGLGYNPRKIADLIQDAFGGGLTDALRNTRTVQLYAYRDAARANYMATDGIVTGWIWWAELDDVCCMSCVAEHGTFHELDEQLNDHYNGRCAAIPFIPGLSEEPSELGQAWFEGLSEEEQRAMMGNEKWQAWQDGKFEFGKLSQEQENDVYGKMRTEASLQSLVGE